MPNHMFDKEILTSEKGERRRNKIPLHLHIWHARGVIYQLRYSFGEGEHSDKIMEELIKFDPSLNWLFAVKYGFCFNWRCWKAKMYHYKKHLPFLFECVASSVDSAFDWEQSRQFNHIHSRVNQEWFFHGNDSDKNWKMFTDDHDNSEI